MTRSLTPTIRVMIFVAMVLPWLAVTPDLEAQISTSRDPFQQRPPSESKPLLSRAPFPPGRSLDLNRYCRDRYAGGGGRAGMMEAVLIEPRDAYSWRCRHTWGNTTVDRDIDIAKACTMQWGPWADARLGNRSDPYSWSCTLQPSTVVEPRIDRIYIYGGGAWANQGPGDKEVIELFFSVTHASPKCSGRRVGRRYRVCNEWAFNRKKDDWEYSGKVINHRMPRVNLHSGDALIVAWFAKEHDAFRNYDSCGVRSGKVIITPVTKIFTAQQNWGIGHHRPTRLGGSDPREPPETKYLECLGKADPYGELLVHLKIAYTIERVG